MHVCMAVIKFPQQQLIRSTSCLAGLLPRYPGSAVSSVKLFGRAVLGTAASDVAQSTHFRTGTELALRWLVYCQGPKEVQCVECEVVWVSGSQTSCKLQQYQRPPSLSVSNGCVLNGLHD